MEAALSSLEQLVMWLTVALLVKGLFGQVPQQEPKRQKSRRKKK